MRTAVFANDVFVRENVFDVAVKELGELHSERQGRLIQPSLDHYNRVTANAAEVSHLLFNFTDVYFDSALLCDFLCLENGKSSSEIVFRFVRHQRPGHQYSSFLIRAFILFLSYAFALPFTRVTGLIDHSTRGKNGFFFFFAAIL
jgi:hypothetical protein